jgi:hypothetical protein
VHLLDEGVGEGLALDVELSSPPKPCLAATAA